MTFRLQFTKEAKENLHKLESDGGLSKRLKAVRKALGLLESNPRHPPFWRRRLWPGLSRTFAQGVRAPTPASETQEYALRAGRDAGRRLSSAGHE